MTIATSVQTSAWPEDARELWARLQSHELDDPASDLTFTRRLARDNHWPQDYAERVVEEYRRFCFLACVEAEHVTPSDQIDQAWHLHLLYTRDYWGPFTDHVLRAPLHHGPTRGGGDERRRYDEQYTRTRHAYLRWFGTHPPVDVWPSATERFSRDVRWVRVNRDDHWLLPKRLPRLAPLARAATVCLALLALLLVATDAAAADLRPQTLAEAAYDPYALAASSFLWFYALTCAGLVVTATLTVRARSRAIGGGRGRGTFATDLYTTALLCGGDQRALLTALTQLVDGGQLTVTKEGVVRAMEAPPATAHALEAAVYREAGREETVKGDELFSSDRHYIREQLGKLREDARRKGLLMAEGEAPSAEIWLAVAFPALLAAPRLIAAMGTDRPVGFLVMMLIAATIAGPAIVAANRTDLTEGGLAIRGRARHRAKGMRRRRGDVGGDELIFGAAVLGGTFLTGTALADVRQAMPQAQGGTGGDGGDSGDGGCGGCGGCGG